MLTAVIKLITIGFKFSLFVTKVQSSVNTYWHTDTEQQNKIYLHICIYETMYSQMDQVKIVEDSYLKILLALFLIGLSHMLLMMSLNFQCSTLAYRNVNPSYMKYTWNDSSCSFHLISVIPSRQGTRSFFEFAKSFFAWKWCFIVCLLLLLHK